jgi:hypothetical protein
MPNNYILLETIALTQSAASVTFDNLPTSGYTDLKIVMSARSNSTSGYAETVNMKFNNSSTSDYSWRGLFSVTATPGSNNSSSVAQIRVGSIPSANLTINTFSNTEIYIPNYTSGNFKSASVDAISEVNGTTDFTYALILQAALRSNTAAITSINLSLDAGGTSFVANSTFSLYGIAALGTNPVLSPKAFGGNRIENDGTYWIHTFLTSGTFTPQTNLSCDYLVVAGGGGGGAGSGGGAGGYRTSIGGSPLSVTTTSYPITVGAGGAPGSNNGSDSVFSSITSTGGGGGGTPGKNGGSGGGGDFSSVAFVAGGSASPSGQGNNGGSNGSIITSNFPGGGGGGAGAVGANAVSTTQAGNGGNGLANSISGASVTYAGGGGGGLYNSAGTVGTGGTGGGGSGGRTNSANPNFIAAVAGTPSTGGGGGGQGESSPVGGGSGIVIIRYPIA